MNNLTQLRDIALDTAMLSHLATSRVGVPCVVKLTSHKPWPVSIRRGASGYQIALTNTMKAAQFDFTFWLTLAEIRCGATKSAVTLENEALKLRTGYEAFARRPLLENAMNAGR